VLNRVVQEIETVADSVQRSSAQVALPRGRHLAAR
jgi:hypothetical protein